MISKDFTGVSTPYEEPFDPDLVLDTDVLSVEESVNRVRELLNGREIIVLRDPEFRPPRE